MPRYQVTKKIEFCYGHRLMDYDGPCCHPHGHNGVVEVVLEASKLDEMGITVDFSEINRVVGGWIEATIDHRFILRKDDPLKAALEELGEPMLILDENPTAEVLARTIYEFVSSKGFPVAAIRLWETPNSVAEYRKE